MKRLLLYLFLISVVPSFGKEIFESEKKFYDARLEQQYDYINQEFRSVDYSTSNYQQLLDHFTQSKTQDNAYYVNKFSKLLFAYYLYHENYLEAIKLYDESLKNPHDSSLYSYIMLQIHFYDFFFKYGINDECEKIFERVQFLAEKLPKTERVLVDSFIRDIDGLKIRGNTIEVKRQAIMESIETLEKFKDYFDKTDYEIMLSAKYNHLAITFINENNLHEKSIENSLQLMKKAVRLNANQSVLQSARLYSNMSYAYNLIHSYDLGIEYGLKSIEILKKYGKPTDISSRVWCNVKDSYAKKQDYIQEEKFAHLCSQNLAAYEKKSQHIQQLVAHHLDNPVRQKAIRSNNVFVSYTVTSGGLLLLVCAGFYFFGRKPQQI